MRERSHHVHPHAREIMLVTLTIGVFILMYTAMRALKTVPPWRDDDDGRTALGSDAQCDRVQAVEVSSHQGGGIGLRHLKAAFDEGITRADLDVWASSDGVLFVAHKKKLQARLPASASGDFHLMTAEQIQTLSVPSLEPLSPGLAASVSNSATASPHDGGSNAARVVSVTDPASGSEPLRETIPSFNEVCGVIAAHRGTVKQVTLELKPPMPSSRSTAQLLEAIVRTARNWDVEDRIAVLDSGLVRTDLFRLRQLSSQVQVACVWRADTHSQSPSELADRLTAADFLMPSLQGFSAQLAKVARTHGKPIAFWTVDDGDQLLSALDFEAAVVVSNQPRLLRAELQRMRQECAAGGQVADPRRRKVHVPTEAELTATGVPLSVSNGGGGGARTQAAASSFGAAHSLVHRGARQAESQQQSASSTQDPAAAANTAFASAAAVRMPALSELLLFGRKARR